MSDTKYLRPRHNTWFFQRRIPKALKQLYPNIEILEVSLGTGDIKEARNKRDVILGQMRQQELEINITSPEKQAFTGYVKSLHEAATHGLGDSANAAKLDWADVLDPESMNKTNDPAYIEAFKIVQQGKTESPKYGMTLRELLQRFIQNSEQEDIHTIGTRERYKETVDRYFAFHNVKDMQLQELTREQATKFISHYRTKKLSGATINGHISRLKTLIEFAYRHAWFSKINPFDKHGINTTTGRKKRQPFTVEETKKLLNAIKGEPASLRLLVWLGIYTVTFPLN